MCIRGSRQAGGVGREAAQNHPSIRVARRRCDDALCEVTVCVCVLEAPWALGLGAAMNVAIVAVAAFSAICAAACIKLGGNEDVSLAVFALSVRPPTGVPMENLCTYEAPSLASV